MPSYDFASDDGEVIERTFRMSEVPKSVTENGKTYRRVFSAPSVVGMNWSSISKEMKKANVEAGKRGEDYWRARNPVISS